MHEVSVRGSLLRESGQPLLDVVNGTKCAQREAHQLPVPRREFSDSGSLSGDSSSSSLKAS